MKNKSTEIKKSANYLCEVCLDNKKLVYDDLETHHIIKLQERQDLALNNLNLICLCKKCHKNAEKGLINADYLRKLAKKREDNTPLPFNLFLYMHRGTNDGAT